MESSKHVHQSSSWKHMFAPVLTGSLFGLQGQLVPETFATKEQLKELETQLQAEEAQRQESKGKGRSGKAKK